MFVWTDRSIQWYQDAAQYTKHHKIVCKEIVDLFQINDDVYDLGCGLGYLDLELAPHVKSITGFDLEQKVIEQMRQNIRARGLENVSAKVMDWSELPQESCDIVLASSAGTIEKNLADFINICKKRVVILKRKSVVEGKGFITEYAKLNGADADEQYLIEQKIPYESRCFMTEFGQPFRSYADAEIFLEHYSLNTKGKDKEVFLRELVRPVKDETYVYFMPNQKMMQVFIIEKEEYINRK